MGQGEVIQIILGVLLLLCGLYLYFVKGKKGRNGFICSSCFGGRGAVYVIICFFYPQKLVLEKKILRDSLFQMFLVNLYFKYDCV